MKLSFNIGKCDITIIDTDPGYDCSQLSDGDLEELTGPCLDDEKPWDKLSQDAFEEQVHRNLLKSGYYDR